MRSLIGHIRGLRIYLKIFTCFTLILALFYLSYWTKCAGGGESRVPYTSFSLLSKVSHQTRSFPSKYSLTSELVKDELNYGDEMSDMQSDLNRHAIRTSSNSVHSNAVEKIECVINDDYSIPCQRDDEGEVFVPFSFLKKYFEVYGKMTSSGVDGAEHFEWQHSYSKYFIPKIKYDPKGSFMNFENFNVEARDRVKCVSAMDGVPVSTQWDARGYLYPIQVAQFALSHFSKNLTDTKRRTVKLENGNSVEGEWYATEGKFARKWDDQVHSEVLEFQTSDSLLRGGISLSLSRAQDYVIGLDIKFTTNGSLSVVADDKDRHERYFVHYVFTPMYVVVSGNHIYYGLGSKQSTSWRRFTRDITVDVRKGLNSKAARKSKLKIQLISLVLRGEGCLDNLTVSSSAHMAHFFDATDWMVKNQDSQGGWSIPVERKFNSQGMGNLSPGWYSAMAQGQAISALTRAYYLTKSELYLQAALKAVKLFRIKSEDKGVMTNFMEKHVWYEEYPTVPGSFVLNGFIYSLIGLYDLKVICEQYDCGSVDVESIYEDGMKSLKALLPLFDCGSGSFYDLRHFTLGIAPNIARWDYHTTHIGQLLLLSTIDDAEILKSTSRRWIEYMKGKRAPHN
ncbi:hypothetical protein CHUAL_008421 [Chamberlinius hualienensis]